MDAVVPVLRHLRDDRSRRQVCGELDVETRSCRRVAAARANFDEKIPASDESRVAVQELKKHPISRPSVVTLQCICAPRDATPWLFRQSECPFRCGNIDSCCL